MHDQKAVPFGVHGGKEIPQPWGFILWLLCPTAAFKGLFLLLYQHKHRGRGFDFSPLLLAAGSAVLAAAIFPLHTLLAAGPDPLGAYLFPMFVFCLLTCIAACFLAAGILGFSEESFIRRFKAFAGQWNEPPVEEFSALMRTDRADLMARALLLRSENVLPAFGISFAKQTFFFSASGTASLFRCSGCGREVLRKDAEAMVCPHCGGILHSGVEEEAHSPHPVSETARKICWIVFPLCTALPWPLSFFCFFPLLLLALAEALRPAPDYWLVRRCSVVPLLLCYPLSFTPFIMALKDSMLPTAAALHMQILLPGIVSALLILLFSVWLERRRGRLLLTRLAWKELPAKTAEELSRCTGLSMRETKNLMSVLRLKESR